MGTLGNDAKEYEPKQLKNISDLEIVKTEWETKEMTFGEGDNEFTAKVIEVNGEKYRVPVSVLKNLKAIMKEKPELKSFKVIKSGSGMDTTYTVIPIEFIR